MSLVLRMLSCQDGENLYMFEVLDMMQEIHNKKQNDNLPPWRIVTKLHLYGITEI